MLKAICRDTGKYLDAKDAKRDVEYICPSCLESLILRKGDLVRPHFAHKSSSSCNSSSNKMSNWHLEWQKCFDEEYREIIIENDVGVKRRADVKVGKNIVEFQHSGMSLNEFDSRNKFYTELGYDIYWLFDMSEQYNTHRLRSENLAGEGGEWWNWFNRIKIFDNLQLGREDKQIHIFFDLGCEFYGNDYFIIHPVWHMGMLDDVKKREAGFSRFLSEDWYNRSGFIEKIKLTSVGFRYKDGMKINPFL